MNTLNILQHTPASLPASSPVSMGPPGIDSQGFLRLLITQLQHQDPLTPTDPGNTVLQLASLAQVSALQEISALLKQLLAGKGSRADAPSEESDLGSA
jgi:flagellar basal-body rod modification protein FlgD